MSVLDRPRTRGEVRAGAAGRRTPRRRGPRLTAGLALAGVLAGALALLWVASPLAARVTSPAEVGLAEGAGLRTDFGPEGTWALRYRYGRTVEVRVPLRNASPLPLTVTDVRLEQSSYPLLEPLGDAPEPTTLAPFGTTEVVLRFEYANCRYYHERAHNTYDRILVSGSVLGRQVERTAALLVPLVVHSQVILDCPERTYVRGDDRRT